MKIMDISVTLRKHKTFRLMATLFNWFVFLSPSFCLNCLIVSSEFLEFFEILSMFRCCTTIS